MPFLELFILAFASWGLGALVQRLLRFRFGIGFTLGFGFYVLPLLLFVLNLLGGLGLAIASRSVFALAVMAALYEGIFCWRGRVFRWEELRHPSLIFLLLFALSLCAAPVYTIREWDEFSHWLLMPRQMALADALLSTEFLVKSFATYTPGWPALVLFPQLVVKGLFHERSAWLVPAFSACIYAGAIFDIARAELGRQRHAWLVTAFVVLIPFGSIIFRPNLLIEIPGMHALGFGLLLLLARVRGHVSPWSAIAAFALLCAAIFLLKAPYLVLLVAGLFVLRVPLRADRARWPLQGILPWLVMVLPVAVLFFVWRAATAGYPAVFAPAQAQSSWTLDRWVAVPRMLWSLLKYDPLLVVALITGAVATRGEARLRPFYRATLALFATYFMGLAYLYIFSYGAYEGPRLASFRRYEGLVAVPVKSILILSFALGIVPLPGPRLQGWLQRARAFWERQSNRRRQLFVNLALCLGITIPMVSLLKPVLVLPADPDLTVAQRLVENLSALPRADGSATARPYVQLIAQGDDGRAMLRLRHVALGAVRLADGWSFGSRANDIWMSVVDASEFEQRLLQMDFIWLKHVDPWMRERLARLVRLETCGAELDGSLLRRTRGDALAFSCGKF